MTLRLHLKEVYEVYNTSYATELEVNIFIFPRHNCNVFFLRRLDVLQSDPEHAKWCILKLGI